MVREQSATERACALEESNLADRSPERPAASTKRSIRNLSPLTD
jgi:hypothetical protein